MMLRKKKNETKKNRNEMKKTVFLLCGVGCGGGAGREVGKGDLTDFVVLFSCCVMVVGE